MQSVAQPARAQNAPLGSEGRVSGIARRESISAAPSAGASAAASPRRPAAVTPPPAAPSATRSLRERLMSRS